MCSFLDFSVVPKEDEREEVELVTTKGFRIEELDPIIKDSDPEVYEVISHYFYNIDY